MKKAPNVCACIVKHSTKQTVSLNPWKGIEYQYPITPSNYAVHAQYISSTFLLNAFLSFMYN